MKISFHAHDEFIKIPKVKLIAPNGNKTTVNMVLATGYATSGILPSVLERLGYNPGKIAKNRGLIGTSSRKGLRAFSIPEILINDTVTLYEIRFNIIENNDIYKAGVEGLLGFNILREFNINIDFTDNFVELEKITSNK